MSAKGLHAKLMLPGPVRLRVASLDSTQVFVDVELKNVRCIGPLESGQQVFVVYGTPTTWEGEEDL